MREAEIRRVGDTEYEFKPLATSAMLKLMTRLAKIMGPAVGVLDNVASLASMATAGHVLAELAQRIDEAEVLAVCKVLSDHTTLLLDDGRKPLLTQAWETHFAGDPVSLLRWLGTALEVNFGPLGAWLGEAAKAPPSVAGAVPAR